MTKKKNIMVNIRRRCHTTILISLQHVKRSSLAQLNQYYYLKEVRLFYNALEDSRHYGRLWKVSVNIGILEDSRILQSVIENSGRL